MEDKGMLVAGITRALLMAKGNMGDAVAYASGLGPRYDQAARWLKSAVTAMGRDDLANLRQQVGFDLRELTRPRSIRGRLAGLRRTPFDTRMIQTTGGTTAEWGGDGAPIPASKMNLSADLLVRRSLGAIAAFDEELAKSSDPLASTVISRDLANACLLAEDQAFANFLNAGTALKPAAVTYGSPTFTSSGTNASAWDYDLGRLVTSLLDGGSNLEFATWVMDNATARMLASLRDNGVLAYPEVQIKGIGRLHGLPQIASGAIAPVGSPVERYLALIDADQIWHADDGEAEISFAKAGSFEMVDNPTNSANDGTATTQVSLWQTHSVGVRAIRTLNWAPTSVNASAVLKGFTI